MDKKLLYGIGIGAAAVALFLYFKKKPVVKETTFSDDKPTLGSLAIPTEGINTLGFRESTEPTEADLVKQLECEKDWEKYGGNYGSKYGSIFQQSKDDYIRSCMMFSDLGSRQKDLLQ